MPVEYGRAPQRRRWEQAYARKIRRAARDPIWDRRAISRHVATSAEERRRWLSGPTTSHVLRLGTGIRRGRWRSPDSGGREAEDRRPSQESPSRNGKYAGICV